MIYFDLNLNFIFTIGESQKIFCLHFRHVVVQSAGEATHKMIALRQKEIDHNERYWRNAKFVDVGKEKDFTPVDISFIEDDN